MKNPLQHMSDQGFVIYLMAVLLILGLLIYIA
jgi:hypothetical protein